MSPHSDTLSRFRDNQYLLFLLNAAYLAEKQQIPVSSTKKVFGLTQSGLLPTISLTQGEHAKYNHYYTTATVGILLAH